MKETTILIPTDFSENSWHALRYAANLFKKDKCKFLLLNTFYATPPNVQAVAVDFLDPLTESSKDSLEALEHKIKTLHHHTETQFECLSIYGDLVRIVKEISEDKHIDYVILGTKGATGLKEMFMGSNTVSIISSIKTPIICVPENAEINSPKKIVLPSDFEDINSEDDLLPLKRIAKKHGAKILILILRNKHTEPVSISDAHEDLELHSYLKNVPHDIYIRSEENIEEGIQEFSHEQKADMITMITRSHSFWESLFRSSITKKMAFHTDIPLLIIHESK